MPEGELQKPSCNCERRGITFSISRLVEISKKENDLVNFSERVGMGIGEIAEETLLRVALGEEGQKKREGTLGVPSRLIL
ncbi:MAG: hypothetical protein G3M78_15170 [Candidatus Nitrohelix vancouverensis]|uniref:Uncharacterized protein n=1 Tax=Candidatus Nitrohelix vancouverensis TaxID=2705534 RepID=A0A7T0C552_9BACT|nr:MAG: hypothetical protein G3M78_15170 [Candidatus Nitrohelix vancouverensis]